MKTEEQTEETQEAEAPKKAKKMSREEFLKTAKASDDIVIGLRVPTIQEDEEQERKIGKINSKQHVKYAFWLRLAKNEKGKARHSTLKGTELLGYLDEQGKEVLFK